MYDFYGQYKTGANVSLGGSSKKVNVITLKMSVTRLDPLTTNGGSFGPLHCSFVSYLLLLCSLYRQAFK